MELVDSDHDMARRDEEEDKIGNKYYTVRTQERVCIILEPGLSECVYNVHLHIEGKQLMDAHCTAWRWWWRWEEEEEEEEEGEY